MKKLFLTISMLLITVCVFAQTRSIQGVVLGSDGDTLLGATVRLVGSPTGTVSNTDGYYSINVPATGKVQLTFSYTGHNPKTIDIGTESTYNVTLQSTDKTLNELVVIGYQTVQRKDLTGAVSSTTAKDLKDIPVNSAGEALEGRLAGVQITSNEGQPGADVTIKVRGGNSITQDNSPLYIIDGIEVEDGLNAISPQDIASVDVLKDASATAIYGSRGANGVVIITTKRGSDTKGHAKISYNGFYGFQKLGKELPVMSPYDYATYWYSRTRNSDSTAFSKQFGTTWDTLSAYKKAPVTDWQKQLFGRNAAMQSHNIALTGGNQTTQYSISLTSNNQQGIMLLTGYDRELMNMTLDHQFSKKLKISFNTRYNNTTVNGSGTSSPGNATLNFLRQAVRYRPYLPPGQTIYTYDPAYYQATNDGSLGLVNPILLNQAQYKKQVNSIFNISGHLDYNFTDYLFFRTTLGVDITNTQTNAFNDTLTYNAKLSTPSGPEAIIINGKRMTTNNSNVFTYTNSKSTTAFAKDNAITALVGEETFVNHYQGFAQESIFLPGITPTAAFGNMGNGIPQQLPNSVVGTPSIDTTDKLISFFGRLNYTFKQKYLATVSFRADGSSKFSTANNNDWGYFPSAALAWRISQENFMQKLKPVVSDLKIRVSIGEAGNNRIGDGLFLSQFASNTFYYLQGHNGPATSAFVATYLPNPNLKWETTTSRNLGFDASFFDGRIGFSADFYYNSSDNLLLPVPISPTGGYTTQLQNIGSTRNKGMEYQVNATILRVGAFRWTANYNMSFNNNEITSLGGPQSFLIASGWAPSFAPADYIAQVGQQVGTMYGLVADGYYKTSDFTYDASTGRYIPKAGLVNDVAITGSLPQPGQIKYKSLNGDTLVDLTHDRTVIGHANPKFYGGLHQQFTYKAFDLSIFINFEYGNQVYNDNSLEFSNAYTTYANLLGTQAGTWRTIDPKTGAVLQTVSTASAYATGASPAVLDAANPHPTGPMPQSSNSAYYSSTNAVEDGSFIRINNITLGYSLPQKFLSRFKIEKFRVYATVNNLAVITGYSGYDPEANTRRGTPLTPGVDYSTYPRSHTYLFGIQASL